MNRRRRWRLPVCVLLGIVAVAGFAWAVVLLRDRAADASPHAVLFQKTTEAAPAPFIPGADLRGEETVRVALGQGQRGSAGSDLVCDRELLIRALKARPERLRRWAAVLGITPRYRAVAGYIRSLRPVTLTRDTRVTSHSFVNGRAVAYQAILQAGTAVLVDEMGVPVTRCRCGSPLLEPAYGPISSCRGCPPDYGPPPPCDPYDDCWRRYPNPPPIFSPSARPPNPQAAPLASFTPATGGRGDSFALSVSGFEPARTLSVVLKRPDGEQERYAITTGSDGSGEIDFEPSGPDAPGTYIALIKNQRTGAETQAAAELLEQAPAPEQPAPAPEEPPPPEPGQTTEP